MKKVGDGKEVQAGEMDSVASRKTALQSEIIRLANKERGTDPADIKQQRINDALKDRGHH